MITRERIVAVVCKHYGVSEEEMTSDLRRRDAVNARHAYIFFMHELRQESFASIAHSLGRHHYSAMVKSYQRTAEIVRENNGQLAHYKAMNTELSNATATT